MKATNIIWDTDGQDVNLPTEVNIPDGVIDSEDIGDYLSELTGFCHLGFIIEK